MAFRPCLTCGRNFMGSTQFTFVTYWVGEAKYRYRMCQCFACAAELRNTCATDGQVEREGVWEDPESVPTLAVVSSSQKVAAS